MVGLHNQAEERVKRLAGTAVWEWLACFTKENLGKPWFYLRHFVVFPYFLTEICSFQPGEYLLPECDPTVPCTYAAASSVWSSATSKNMFSVSAWGREASFFGVLRSKIRSKSIPLSQPLVFELVLPRSLQDLPDGLLYQQATDGRGSRVKTVKEPCKRPQKGG